MTPSEPRDRKYVMTRVKGGDYLLPSNDATKIYRLMKYEDGPSHGIEDWPKDKEVWGVWVWNEPLVPGRAVDLEDWDRWEFCEGTLDTRQQAVDAALKLGGTDV